MSNLHKSLTALSQSIEEGAEETDLHKSMSYDDEREIVRTALNEKYKPKKSKMGYAMGGWVSDMYPGHCVAQVEIEKGKPKYYKIDYSIVDGKATLGEPIEVKRSWEPVSKSLSAEDGGFSDVAYTEEEINKSSSPSKALNKSMGGNVQTEDGFVFDFDPPVEQEVRLAAPMVHEHDEIVDRIDRSNHFIPNISALKYGVVDE